MKTDRCWKKSWCWVCAVLLVVMVGWVSAQTSNTLVGAWLMQDGGGVAVSDSSGFGNHGWLVGDARFVSDSQLGGAVEIAGPTGAIIIPDSSVLRPAEGTLEFWLKPQKKTMALLFDKQTDRLVRTNQSIEHHVFWILAEPKGKIGACILNDDPVAGPYTCELSREGVYNPGVWQLVSMRWDGQHLALFVNGRLEFAKAYSPIPDLGLSYAGTANNIVLADNSDMYYHEKSANYEYLGRISGLRMYNYARQDSEILNDYRAQMP